MLKRASHGLLAACVAALPATAGWPQDRYRGLNAQRCAVVDCRGSSSSGASRGSSAPYIPPQPDPRVLEQHREEAARQQQLATAHNLSAQGMAAMDRGDWADAIAKFTASLDFDPNDSSVRDRLRYAQQRLVDLSNSRDIGQFQQQNQDQNEGHKIDAFRRQFRGAFERTPDVDKGLVIGPSIGLQDWTRLSFERQLMILGNRQIRARAELDKLDAIGRVVHPEASENQRVIEELAEDSVTDVLDILQGVAAVYGGKLPAPAGREIDGLLTAGEITAHGSWAMRAQPGSERRSAQALDALVGLTDVLTIVPPSGVKPETWEALRYAVGDMRKLMKDAKGGVSFPDDRPRLEQFATCMDQIVQIAGSLPAVGAPIRGLRAAGQLVPYNLPLALYRLMNDRRELGTASVNLQSARRFWITRIGDLQAQSRPYEISLGISPQ